MMDATARYSISSVVSDASIKSAIHVMVAHWISQFCRPDSVQYDQAFDRAEFRKDLN